MRRACGGAVPGPIRRSPLLGVDGGDAAGTVGWHGRSRLRLLYLLRDANPSTEVMARERSGVARERVGQAVRGVRISESPHQYSEYRADAPAASVQGA